MSNNGSELVRPAAERSFDALRRGFVVRSVADEVTARWVELDGAVGAWRELPGQLFRG